MYIFCDITFGPLPATVIFGLIISLREHTEFPPGLSGVKTLLRVNFLNQKCVPLGNTVQQAAETVPPSF